MKKTVLILILFGLLTCFGKDVKAQGSSKVFSQIEQILKADVAILKEVSKDNYVSDWYFTPNLIQFVLKANAGFYLVEMHIAIDEIEWSSFYDYEWRDFRNQEYSIVTLKFKEEFSYSESSGDGENIEMRTEFDLVVSNKSRKKLLKKIDRLKN